jgi:hypothetical protein
MGAAHEGRVSRMIRRQADAAAEAAVVRDTLRLPRSPRKAVKTPSCAGPSRAAVRRMMRAMAAECETATHLVESCASDVPEAWLDDETHWIWEMALQEMEAV